MRVVQRNIFVGLGTWGVGGGEGVEVTKYNFLNREMNDGGGGRFCFFCGETYPDIFFFICLGGAERLTFICTASLSLSLSLFLVSKIETDGSIILSLKIKIKNIAGLCSGCTAKQRLGRGLYTLDFFSSSFFIQLS